MKKIIRIGIVLFIISAIYFLFRFNPSQDGLATDYSKKIEIIVFIFIVTFICIAYIVYEFYRIMYSEMQDRMNMLIASENDLQTIYDSMTMLMIEINPEYHIINVNEAVCQFSGRKRNHIRGKSLDMVLDFEEDAMQKLKHTIRETFESKRSCKAELENGGRIFEATTFQLQDSQEHMEKVLIVLNDVSQARAMYHQMLQDNKMIAVGQLAAGVAHEIRNPLGLIRNYCHLLKKSPSSDEQLKGKAIAMMEKAVDRSSEIIDNLLRFSRISNSNWKEVNLKDAIKSVINLEAHLFVDKNIKIDFHCDPGITVVVVLESLEMILVNLLINAVDAMAGIGQISINCTADSDYAVITVADTGEGIPKEIIGSIFNPFFTTKENHKGSGLGLYIVYNEVSKLGGKIEVESEVGEGTTFKLTLPINKGDDYNER